MKSEPHSTPEPRSTPSPQRTARHSACEALDNETLQRRISELQELPEGELEVINLPIHDVVRAVDAAASAIERLLPRLQQLGSFNGELVAAMAKWAQVLSFADAMVKLDEGPKPVPKALIAQGLQLRRDLKRDTRNLTARGIINDPRLETVTSSPSYTKLANDVLTQVQVLQETKASWTGRSPLSQEELDTARAIASEIHSAVRKRAEWRPSPWHDLRVRAFTMVRRAHTEARLTVMFLLRDEVGAEGGLAPLAHGRYAKSRQNVDICCFEEPIQP
jgi:hypothetical protein